MYYTRFKSQWCEILLAGDERGLSRVHLYTEEGQGWEIPPEWTYNQDFFTEAMQELTEYFNGERRKFTVELNPLGTAFQKKVWNELLRIPYGQVISYRQLAERIGNSKASRAVGNANGKNPIPLIIPCHRVIGSSGKLTGFAFGLRMKQALLHFEQLMDIYQRLSAHYGQQHWWPAETPYEVMVGAILTQNTSWSNVVKALDNFKGRLSPLYIKELSITELAEIIRPSGCYNQKAKRLKLFNSWYEQYSFDIDKVKKQNGETLRKELLHIKGIGCETADCILTYALEKPFYVIDAYTVRIFERVGLKVPKTYDQIRSMIEAAIPRDLALYNEYHALIVKHAQEFCLKTPQCRGCPLSSICRYNF